MTSVAILGSTGSIGVNALDVIRRLNARLNGGGFRVRALSAQSSVEKLQKQISEWRPEAAAVSDPGGARALRAWAARHQPRLKVWEGAEGLERLAAQKDVDVVLSSVVGAVGLLPLLAALKAGKKVALANKEALIVAGDLLTATARRHGAQIIPVDSEHSAIFQCLPPPSSGAPRSIRRLILTASGGAFYRHKGSLDRVTPAQALKHPTWTMGRKITIDCATLTNKGLEAIEAHHLFGVPMENIHIVIHPQSIVHSLVEFDDGAMLAQLSHPDMRLPIQYALTHPERHPTALRPLNLEEIRKLEFDRPDFRRFPCLGLVLEAGRRGGTWPAAFNGANEAAVRAFLDERISFLGIPRLLARVMRAYGQEAPRRAGVAAGLREVLQADAWARQAAEDFIRKGKK